MADLIDRQKAINALCRAGCDIGYCGVSCPDVMAIEDLPSAVVRCKDCIYCESNTEELVAWCNVWGNTTIFMENKKMKDDVIYRKDALDALDVLCQEHRYKIPGKIETYSQYNEAWQDALDRAEGAIGNLLSVDIDLSDFSDRLWRAAYERGKAEVVRCKDCRYGHRYFDIIYDTTDSWVECRNPDGLNRDVSEDSFCSCGERKDDY